MAKTNIKKIVCRQVIYGHIFTFDSKNRTAEAIGIDPNGKISFVGSKKDIKKYITPKTKIINHSHDYIYPGFIDGHSHPGLLGSVITGGCLCTPDMTNIEVLNRFNQYIGEHPNQKLYKCYGSYTSNKFGNKKYHFTYKIMDKYLTNLKGKKALAIIIDYGGHSCCLNSYALKKIKEWFLIDTNVIKKYQTMDVAELDDVNHDGKEVLDGNFSESLAHYMYLSIPIKLNELKKAILIQQDEVLAKMGYTTVADCMLWQHNIPTVQALSELGKEGKLKYKVRGYFSIFETNMAKAKEQIQHVVSLAKKYNNEYFKIIGIKVILDGVSEKESCYTLKDYAINPYHKEFPEGYRGIFRWNENLRKIIGKGPDLKDIIIEANKHGLAVTSHAFGDAAVHFILDKYEEARKVVKFDRNSIAHCAFVIKKDIKRFKDLNVIPLVAPQWSIRTKAGDVHEEVVFGKDDGKHQERNINQMYKIKSFIKELGEDRVSFHTDGMCKDGVPFMLYTALNRVDPNNAIKHKKGYIGPRNKDEDINLRQAFKCLLANPAYLFGDEDSIGSIEVGKCADLSIYPVDFTKVSAFKQANYKISHTPLLRTYVNGRLAYHKK